MFLRRGSRKKWLLFVILGIGRHGLSNIPSPLKGQTLPCLPTLVFLGLPGSLTSSLELEGSLYAVLASQERWGEVELVLGLAAGTAL